MYIYETNEVANFFNKEYLKQIWRDNYKYVLCSITFPKILTFLK
jgi:hypothetical protein